MTDFAGNQQIIEIIYLVASALFILSLKMDELSDDSSARRPRRRDWHGLGDRRNPAPPRHRGLPVDSLSL